jgi:heat-inducible transcriptional repressor
MQAHAFRKNQLDLLSGLNDREEAVLRFVIHNYVMSANPVSSRSISRLTGVGLSAASIRNTMADLEDKGLLAHPHTSSGRVPTDLGYRLYVNHLMDQQRLSLEERHYIESNVQELMPDVEAVLGRTAGLLSKISQQLGVVLAPSFDAGKLERLDLVPMGARRLLVVVTVASGLARTVTLEIDHCVENENLPQVSRMIQQRLVGLTLREIRETIHERLASLPDSGQGIARLFIDSTQRLFACVRQSDLIVDGVRNIPDIPEFQADNFRGVLEVLEDREMVLHLMNQQVNQLASDDFAISIGQENLENCAADYSLITAQYHVGSLPGTLGVIGPRRMDYSKLTSLVSYTAKLIRQKLGQ